jgi:hypothetical protein
VPIFSRIPASSTEPTVGASVWASGSQVCSGHTGTLTANPRATAANTIVPKVPPKRAAAPISWRARMSKVRPAASGLERSQMARNPSSMITDPIRV